MESFGARSVEGALEMTDFLWWATLCLKLWLGWAVFVAVVSVVAFIFVIYLFGRDS